MKNFTKAALIITAVLAILGCAFCAVSFGIGFRFPEFWDEVEAGKYIIRPWVEIPFIHEDHSVSEATVTEDWEDMVESYAEGYAVDHGAQSQEFSSELEQAVEGSDIAQNQIAEEYASERQHFPLEQVKKIKVEVYSGTVSMMETADDGKDNISVAISYDKKEDASDAAMYMDGDTLKIMEKKSDGDRTNYNSNTQITIGIPRKMMEELWLEELELELDGGSVYLDVPFTAKEIDLKVNAGECIASGKLTAVKEMDVELNVGEGYLSELEAKELKVTAGAGNMTIDKINAEKVDMECGMGTLDAVIAGKETDYSFEIKCGVGSVEVGDYTVSGIAGEKKIQNPGSKKMNVKCGMGTVYVRFSDS